MSITAIVKEKILGERKVRTALMIAFDRTEQSIRNWAEKDDIRLTTKKAITVLIEVTGFTEAEILEPEPETA